MLGDDIIDSEIPCLRQMIDVYERFNGAPIVAVQEVEPDAISRFGVIAGEEIEPNVFRITDMVEKPKREDAPSNLAIHRPLSADTRYLSSSREYRSGRRR
jgi:UTP--glucose-1-phosphate uridylyltransferase